MSDLSDDECMNLLADFTYLSDQLDAIDQQLKDCGYGNWPDCAPMDVSGLENMRRDFANQQSMVYRAIMNGNCSDFPF